MWALRWPENKCAAEGSKTQFRGSLPCRAGYTTRTLLQGLSNLGWDVMVSCTFNHVSDNLFVFPVQFDTLYGKKAAALYTQVQFLFVCEKL